LCQNAENRDMFPCNDFPDKSKTLSDRTYQVIQTIYIYTYLCNMYNYITVYIVNVLISMYTLTHMYIYIYIQAFSWLHLPTSSPHGKTRVGSLVVESGRVGFSPQARWSKGPFPLLHCGDSGAGAVKKISPRGAGKIGVDSVDRDGNIPLVSRKMVLFWVKSHPFLGGCFMMFS
jgi:hypothetical protein